MKVSRSFALELEDMQLIDTTSKELKISQNEALAVLVRHGSVRLKQLDKQMMKLAPDPEEMR